MNDIKFYLNSSDPLTSELADFLLCYKEEDAYVDYKQTVDINSEKEWLGLTKDISAFANTSGGYLVFGVEDLEKNVIELSKEVIEYLTDTIKIQDKINRHLEPDIKTIRSKKFIINNKSIVIMFIPQSKNITHFIKKDGTFNYPNQKKSRPILHKGTFYVRRVGGNHLADSRDLDALIEKRIDKFREALMDKVARVVKAPEESNLFILSKDPETPSGEKFIIEDSPNALPIKGMSFTVAPEGFEENIAAWSVLAKGKQNIKPPPEIVWDWYLNRTDINIKENHRLSIFQFSLWALAPPFYWIQGIENSIIRKSLIEAIRNRPHNDDIDAYLAVSCMLGKSTHKAVISAFGDYANKLGRYRKFPSSNPKDVFCSSIKPNKKQSDSHFKEKQILKINKLAKAVIDKKKQAGIRERWEARQIDCFLYAQTDNYKSVL
jgi:hypothetical protein